MDSRFSQKILHTITDESVNPKSRWHFIVRRLALWVPGVLATVIGALAVSALLFGLAHSGWRYAPVTHDSLLAAIVGSLPYLWIVLAGIFAFVTVRLVRTTHRGYRYRTLSIVLGSILLSIILGTIGYVSGIGKYLDTRLAPHTPNLSITAQQQSLWSNPEAGRLAGTVRKIHDTHLRIRDFDGYFWNVDTSELNARETTLINTLLDRNRQVRMVGYIDEEFPNTFHACVLMPLFPRFEGNRPQPVPFPRDLLENASIACSAAMKEKAE